MRHFVLVLHSHMMEIQKDGTEGLARSESHAALESPRIHVWARSPDSAVAKLGELMNRLDDKEREQ